MLQEFNHVIYLEAPTMAEMKADIEDIPKDSVVESNPLMTERPL